MSTKSSATRRTRYPSIKELGEQELTAYPTGDRGEGIERGRGIGPISGLVLRAVYDGDGPGSLFDRA